jgi:hypothetical protein
MSKADDNQFYLDAVTEFEGKNRDKALWAKCVTLAEGDEDKAKYQYLNESVEKFKSKSVEDKKAEINATLEGKFFITNLKEGNYGLFKTYWVYYILVEFVLTLIMRVITQILGADNNEQGFIISSAIFFIFIFIYKIFVWMGIWRAANRYKENEVWANLAKVMVVFSILITMSVSVLMYDALKDISSGLDRALIPSFFIILCFFIVYTYRRSFEESIKS